MSESDRLSISLYPRDVRVGKLEMGSSMSPWGCSWGVDSVSL